MSAVLSLNDDDVLTALRTFILSLISCEVIQALDNGVPTPKDPYIAMQSLGKNRLSTNTHDYADPSPSTGTDGVMQAIQFCIQIDCYGPQSGDWAALITTMFRDPYGFDAMGPNVAPLYADEAKQMPVVDGEENFEQRYMITAYLQYNPVVTVPVQFFTVVDINLIDVDATNFNNLDVDFVLDSQSLLG